jgi:large subunit ribosomal protein L3
MIGLIGRKTGMTQVFDDTGRLIPVSVIEFVPNVVVGKKSADKDGYDAIVVGLEDKKKQRTTKAYAGQFPEGITPKKLVREIRDFGKEVSVGDSLGVDILSELRYVDVTATSKGKGFQGVMKRWNFGGGRSTHGSKFHREPGSTGQRTYPHKTFKNVKLPGRMGREQVTIQNLRVVRVDAESSCILVRGAIPGPRDCAVLVREAVKKTK